MSTPDLKDEQVRLIPRNSVGIVLAKHQSLRGKCLVVVVNSTELGTNASRNFAYEVGKAIGSVLSEGYIQDNFLIAFKGKQSYVLTTQCLKATWAEIYRDFFVGRVPPLQTRLYPFINSQGSASKRSRELITSDMADLLQQCINGEQEQEPESVQEVQERDPSLPDHVFESARVPI